MPSVLVICDGLLPPEVLSGGSRNILQLHKTLANQGMTVHVLTATWRNRTSGCSAYIADLSRRCGITVHVIDRPFRRFFGLWFVFTRIAYLVWAYHLWRRYRYDMIHDYSSSPLMMNRTGLLKRLTGAKTILTICTANKSILGSFQLGPIKPDKVLCSNPHLLETLKQRLSGQTLEVLPVPIESRFFEDHEKPSTVKARPDGHARILYLGHLSKNKGIEDFISVIPPILRENPNASTTVVNPPPAADSTISWIRRQKITDALSPFGNRALFIEGYVNVKKILSTVDILAYPLVTLHGTLVPPSVLMEAMACGKAVVAPDFPEFGGFLGHEKNCLLYPPSNLTLLAKMLIRLLGDSNLRHELGEQASSDVSRFKIDRVCERLLYIYRTLLKTRVEY
jgi:glycosyltransferase involved in cell wall biosynthesis